MGPRCVWESTLITKVRGGQRHILVEKPLEEGFFFFFLLWRVLQGADATERAIGMWVSGWQGRQFWEEGKGQCAAGQADGWEGTGKGCVSGWIQGALGPRGGR